MIFYCSAVSKSEKSWTRHIHDFAVFEEETCAADNWTGGWTVTMVIDVVIALLPVAVDDSDFLRMRMPLSLSRFGMDDFVVWQQPGRNVLVGGRLVADEVDQ